MAELPPEITSVGDSELLDTMYGSSQFELVAHHADLGSSLAVIPFDAWPKINKAIDMAGSVTQEDIANSGVDPPTGVGYAALQLLLMQEQEKF